MQIFVFLLEDKSPGTSEDTQVDIFVQTSEGDSPSLLHEFLFYDPKSQLGDGNHVAMDDPDNIPNDENNAIDLGTWFCSCHQGGGDKRRQGKFKDLL